MNLVPLNFKVEGKQLYYDPVTMQYFMLYQNGIKRVVPKIKLMNSGLESLSLPLHYSN